MEIPDSLGGKKLVGYIKYLVDVCKSGQKLGYKIVQMDLTVGKKKKHAWYSCYQQTREGDSLLTLYTPWVKAYYDSLQYIVNGRSRSFEKNDTVNTCLTIRFPIPRK